MKRKTAKTLRGFAVELVIYAVLVAGYFFVVLRFFAGRLHNLEQHHMAIYGLVAIGLIVAQAIVLEIVTTWLLRFFSGRSE
jgi:hypothetical protein